MPWAIAAVSAVLSLTSIIYVYPVDGMHHMLSSIMVSRMVTRADSSEDSLGQRLLIVSALRTS